MRGPVPKDPALRVRRNKKPSRAILDPDGAKGIKAPPLRATDIGIKQGGVHPLVHRWWAKLWKEPMAPRWLQTDIEGLYLIARLRHDFWTNGGTTLAAEIRQQERRFGLDQAARNSLDWRIENSRVEKDETPAAPVEVAEELEDPRTLLRAVK